MGFIKFKYVCDIMNEIFYIVFDIYKTIFVKYDVMFSKGSVQISYDALEGEVRGVRDFLI